MFIATLLFKVEQQPLLFNLVAGAIRITILIAYLYSISLMKDIYRLFQYHGAEHKAVFTFEQNAPLEISSAMQFTRFHPRCGTSFVLLVMLVSVLLFSLLDTAVLLTYGSLSLAIRLATHIPFIPIVGGISYEVLKFSAKHASVAPRQAIGGTRFVAAKNHHKRAGRNSDGGFAVCNKSGITAGRSAVTASMLLPLPWVILPLSSCTFIRNDVRKARENQRTLPRSHSIAE